MPSTGSRRGTRPTHSCCRRSALCLHQQRGGGRALDAEVPGDTAKSVSHQEQSGHLRGAWLRRLPEASQPREGGADDAIDPSPSAAASFPSGAAGVPLDWNRPDGALWWRRRAAASVRVPGVRRAMAEGLARFVAEAEACRGVDGLPRWPLPPEGALWPKPHNALFDFVATAPGAGWIDEAAGPALRAMRSAGSRTVVGHGDWSAKACGQGRHFGRHRPAHRARPAAAERPAGGAALSHAAGPARRSLGRGGRAAAPGSPRAAPGDRPGRAGATNLKDRLGQIERERRKRCSQSWPERLRPREEAAAAPLRFGELSRPGTDVQLARTTSLA